MLKAWRYVVADLRHWIHLLIRSMLQNGKHGLYFDKNEKAVEQIVGESRAPNPSRMEEFRKGLARMGWTQNKLGLCDSTVYSKFPELIRKKVSYEKNACWKGNF